MVGAKYENRTAILAYRADVTLQGAFAQHDRELTRQGFRRTSQTSSGNEEVRGQYQREDGMVALHVQRQDNNVFRAEFDLSQAGRAAQGGNQNPVAATQNARTALCLSEAGKPPALVLKVPSADLQRHEDACGRFDVCRCVCHRAFVPLQPRWWP
ncbi:hypothetical protein Deipe_2206 [Deinococcus peraridilitoris DSM 19664]|uniref:Uncharacterized protein n=1 Tax=Deinococcus peraridilitoris (strain DSM 19664 / LMG 22246 / CIP 109416 / KR-200) TaxID=937777 RepID=L0A1J0_DEIPD|nr:hypothetical protein Deipe_2206 [Deinococcus peraridilitoris DSM 19664]